MKFCLHKFVITTTTTKNKTLLFFFNNSTLDKDTQNSKNSLGPLKTEWALAKVPVCPCDNKTLGLNGKEPKE